ncbi:hypothetical protein BF93_16955 [Brachybacterium phenoliresistens]|uniref:DUF3263 domain-containing protein n=1 Tax=Brachybacterium phenoliresistens TaxID=396014 RepID=Z9JUQ4_9MICO|nr:DUF3263 domain-containing protein [Brachybacterium phenoliresistens]EWS81492.1 hypothetical protein BF93_16955 [Brachybacterium phenoliresistens]
MRPRSAADASANPAEPPSHAPAGDEGTQAPDASGLSDRDRRILALESRTFRFVGAKERRIREELGMTPTAYFVRLNTLLDEPAALREAPALVHRLRGLRTRGDEHRPGPAHAA